VPPLGTRRPAPTPLSHSPRPAACTPADLSASNFGLAYVSKDVFNSGGAKFNRYCFSLSKAALRGADAKPCDPAASPCCAPGEASGPQHLASILIGTSEGCCWIQTPLAPPPCRGATSPLVLPALRCVCATPPPAAAAPLRLLTTSHSFGPVCPAFPPPPPLPGGACSVKAAGTKNTFKKSWWAISGQKVTVSLFSYSPLLAPQPHKRTAGKPMRTGVQRRYSIKSDPPPPFALCCISPLSCPKAAAGKKQVQGKKTTAYAIKIPALGKMKWGADTTLCVHLIGGWWQANGKGGQGGAPPSVCTSWVGQGAGGGGGGHHPLCAPHRWAAGCLNVSGHVMSKPGRRWRRGYEAPPRPD
jgi:hypothetical protein